MASVVLFSVSVTGLAATVTYNGELVHARIEGVVDQPATQKALDDLLARLTAETRLLKARLVVADLRALEFLDMTGFKTLMTWVSSLREAEVATQFRVRFLANAKIVWQRKNLEAIRCLAAGLVTVETQ